MSLTSLAITPFHYFRCVASGHHANRFAPAKGDEKQHSPGVGSTDPTGALFPTHFVGNCSEPIGVEIGFLGLDWFDTVLADMVRIPIFRVPVEQ
jgi:hypothetical protein